MNPVKKIITAPAVEPIDTYDVKEHLRIDGSSDEDIYLAGLIKAARQYVENYCGIQLITQTWDVCFQGWPYKEMELWFYPIQSVEYVKYTSSEGVQYEWSSDDYDVSVDSIPGFVTPGYGLSWPSVTLNKVNPIVARVVCGFGDTGSDVPAPLIQVMKILVAEWYENREQTSVGHFLYQFPAVECLLGNYRMFQGV